MSLSVQEDWQGRRGDAACFSGCWLALLPVRAWRSSFGSLLAFSAMERDLAASRLGRPLSSGWGSYGLSHCFCEPPPLPCKANDKCVWDVLPGEHCQADFSGEHIPQNFPVFAACLLKHPPKHRASALLAFAQVNITALSWNGNLKLPMYIFLSLLFFVCLFVLNK